MKQFAVIFALALASVSAISVPQPGFPEGRIINGYEAAKGEAPYIVSLQTTSNSHFCAGSLLDEVTIVTAAHCLTYNQGQAVAGAHSRTDQENVQIRKFTNAQYVIHENYSGGPLVSQSSSRGAELIGIVSWGYTPCLSTTYPSVYTSVSSFLPWIDENRKAK